MSSQMSQKGLGSVKKDRWRLQAERSACACWRACVTVMSDSNDRRVIMVYGVKLSFDLGREGSRICISIAGGLASNDEGKGLHKW
jgi:hypothetical protein